MKRRTPWWFRIAAALLLAGLWIYNATQAVVLFGPQPEVWAFLAVFALGEVGAWFWVCRPVKAWRP